MSDSASVPRGRHAPPLEVRQDRQRRRLNDAAAAVFARQGYADATAEAIAREAGMSKATFYEHFTNKEDCILSLFDAARERVLGAMASAGQGRSLPPRDRYAQSITALLDVVAAYPDHAQTLMVEIIGAGPRAMERRDAVMGAFAAYIDEQNARDAAAGQAPRLASPDDAYAIVGGIFELVSRQLRTGRPQAIRELEPVIGRLITGVVGAGA
jgi:AcrR family transcriptional regulator